MSASSSPFGARPRTHLPSILCAAGFAALVSCATNPVTGQRQIALISEAQEVEMGKAAAADVQQSIGLVDDPELQRYVADIGTALARRSERPNLPWTFGVLDDPTPNAFALPGGFIFVTRGMLNLMDSEAELASVLGHEVGHVTARHSVTAISRQQVAQLGLGLGSVFFPELQNYGQALETGLGLLFLKHGRDAERQADDLGFRYALDQRYDVHEMADVFAALERAGGESRSALPSWLSTHPAPGERMEAVKARIAALGAPPGDLRVGRAEFLNQIDGLVYGENPRHGFFRENAFYHPDLAFRFTFPPGWQTRNLPRAVVGVSPRNDAAVQLTLAGAADPVAAARQFLSQQGLRPLDSTRRSINGLPAVISAFDAATQEGTLRGLVAHVQHGDQTYQVAAYTAAAQFSAYGPLFEQVVGSFARVTDREVLDVQPARIDVVTLPRTMTVREFARQFDAAVPPETLALLNQAAGPDAELEAGTAVKRVVQPGGSPAAAVGQD